MRDFTTTCYNKNLWIKELLELEKNNGKFFYKSKRNEILQIINVIIFGIVLEVRQLDRVHLFTVDDGTGVIVCRRNATNEAEELEDWDWRNHTMESTREMTVNEGTLCDSVFNDQSMQQEEVEANKKAVCKALDSLRWSIVNSFRSSEQIVAGDTVCIYGKIYSYFNVNQIYINVIRPVAIQEELILMTTKLQNTFDNIPEGESRKNESDATAGSSSSSSTYKHHLQTEKISNITNDLSSSIKFSQKSIAHPQQDKSGKKEKGVTPADLISSSTYKHTASLLQTRQKSTIAYDQSSLAEDLHKIGGDQQNHADSQSCFVNTDKKVVPAGHLEGKVGTLKRRSGLMTFDTMIEGRIAGMAGVPEIPSIPPSPVTRPGALLIPPTIFEATSTFDTIVCYDEEPSVHSSSDDDMFVLPTPKKKK